MSHAIQVAGVRTLHILYRVCFLTTEGMILSVFGICRLSAFWEMVFNWIVRLGKVELTWFDVSCQSC